MVTDGYLTYHGVRSEMYRDWITMLGTGNSHGVEVYIILHQINKLVETEIISVTTGGRE